ncbi:MAG: HNH endonuclease, partial [Myxococcota bacterium]
RWSLWRWARRRHPNKSAKWTEKKYSVFFTNHQQSWGTTRKPSRRTRRSLTWIPLARVPIHKHVKIRWQANPYDPKWEKYFEKRQQGHAQTMPRTRTKIPWRGQKGNCPHCRQPVLEGAQWDTHHKKPLCQGGSNGTNNLVLLHPTRHQQLHAGQAAGLPSSDSLMHA